MPDKILHFITELSTGGAQTSLFRILSHLDRNRFSPEVVCLYNGDGPAARGIRALEIPVVDLGMKSKIRLDALWRFGRILRARRPAILHTWLFHANIPGRVLGRLTGVPIVISSERTMGQEGMVRRRVNRLTASCADSIVCVSQAVADFASAEIGLPAGKLLVIPNGTDVAQFANLPSQIEARKKHNLPIDAVIVGAIGRLHSVKGCSVLVDSFKEINSLFPKTCLLFAGAGPERPRLEAQAGRLGLREKVRFVGDQERIPPLLPAVDIAAIPSFHEGMPNAALEAMAAGVPVVATAVGGTPEVVLDGETGILVPPGDPGALAAAITRLVRNPAERTRLGQAGKRRIFENFSIQVAVRKLERHYCELLAGQ